MTKRVAGERMQTHTLRRNLILNFLFIFCIIRINTPFLYKENEAPSTWAPFDVLHTPPAAWKDAKAMSILERNFKIGSDWRDRLVLIADFDTLRPIEEYIIWGFE